MTKKRVQLFSPEGDYTTQLMPETEASYVTMSDGSNVEAKIDDLKQSVSSGKDLIATAVTGKGVPTVATDTFQQMSENIGAIPLGAKIKSVQRSSAYIYSYTDKYKDVHISPVDLSKSILIPNGSSGGNLDLSYAVGSVKLIDEKTVRCYRGNSSSNSITIRFEVVEFVDGIKSVQRGSSTSSASSLSVSIREVNTSKSFSTVSYRTVYDTSATISGWSLKPTSIDLYKYGTETVYYEWNVIEFI